MNTNIICGIMDCGIADLSLLDNITLDWSDIEDELNALGCERPDINNIMMACFGICIGRVQSFISEKIEELKDMHTELQFSIEEYQEELTDCKDEDIEEKINELIHLQSTYDDEILELENLSPYDDIESYHNFIDTKVYIKNNHEVYDNYANDINEIFETATGFNII